MTKMCPDSETAEPTLQQVVHCKKMLSCHNQVKLDLRCKKYFFWKKDQTVGLSLHPLLKSILISSVKKEDEGRWHCLNGREFEVL